MNSIDAKRDGPHVVITVTVGTKTARLTVTPDYAARVAEALIRAAGVRPGDLTSLRNGGRDA